MFESNRAVVVDQKENINKKLFFQSPCYFLYPCVCLYVMTTVETLFVSSSFHFLRHQIKQQYVRQAIGK